MSVQPKKNLKYHDSLMDIFTSVINPNTDILNMFTQLPHKSSHITPFVSLSTNYQKMVCLKVTTGQHVPDISTISTSNEFYCQSIELRLQVQTNDRIAE